MTYTTDTLFKVLHEDGTPYWGGKGKWHLPKGSRPGQWMPVVKEPQCYRRGYHGARGYQLVHWLGPVIWTMEGRGAVDVGADKSAWSEARLISRVETWDEKSARLFACDCAERAWGSSDDRLIDAINVARRYALGRATDDELRAARAAAEEARAAARAAAEAAARAAAEATAWSAAGAAAEAAARAAAEATAWSAAGAAARGAEREWQTQRLLQYLNSEVSP